MRKFTYVISFAGTPGSLRFTAGNDAFGEALRGYLRGDAGAARFWQGSTNGSTSIIPFAHVARVDVTETETDDA